MLLDLANPAGAFEPMVLLLLALVLDAVIGDPEWLYRRIPHPVVVVGRLVDVLDNKLNRDWRSDRDRALRGLIATFGVAAACGCVGAGVAWLTRASAHGWVLELALVTSLIAQQDLFRHVRRVRVALDENGVEAARVAVSMIVGRDPARLDGSGVARAAIESCAENFSDGVVAPVFWYILFGAPGLCVYKAVNTMDSMIGHMTPRHQAYGFAAARLDDVMNWLPARLSGIFLAVAAAFTPTASPWRAFRVMWRDAGKHRSPNAGWPESAMAGALDIALAGPRYYATHAVNDPWLGDGTQRATARDVGRALYIYVVACLVNAAWVGGLAVTRWELVGLLRF